MKRLLRLRFPLGVGKSFSTVRTADPTWLPSVQIHKLAQVEQHAAEVGEAVLLGVLDELLALGGRRRATGWDFLPALDLYGNLLE